ncbi:MAG: hypothetical protein CVU78_05655 [Elusimicrobia bacterium HGW-Elusimicrobia-2]|nr:MAG: hypothetical protein CVU78_05655 [Elusimicrobia bacterium HGW-Elusimicrobia-2]
MLKNTFAAVVFFTAVFLCAEAESAPGRAESASSAVADAPGREVIVEVKIPPGTTTEIIAQKYLKDPSRIKELRRRNKFLPKDDKDVVKSQFVNIPKDLMKEKVCDTAAVSPLVLTRKEKEIRWEKLQPTRRLFPGDGIMTLSDGSARLEFLAGGNLFLAPDSLVFLSENEERPAASFLAGNISADDVRMASRGVKVSPAGGAQYNINTSADKNVRLSVHRGEVDVTAQKKTVKVKEGFRTLVAFDSAPEAPLPLPEAISDLNNLRELEEGEKYHLQIASDEKFKDIIKVKYITRSADVKAAQHALPPGGYYLRVALLSKDGFESKWSSFYYFVKGTESRDVIKVEAITDIGDGKLEVKGSCPEIIDVVINGHPGKTLQGDKFVCVFRVGEAELFTVFIKTESGFLSKRYKRSPSNLWLPID